MAWWCNGSLLDLSLPHAQRTMLQPIVISSRMKARLQLEHVFVKQCNYTGRYTSTKLRVV